MYTHQPGKRLLRDAFFQKFEWSHRLRRQHRQPEGDQCQRKVAHGGQAHHPPQLLIGLRQGQLCLRRLLIIVLAVCYTERAPEWSAFQYTTNTNNCKDKNLY